MTTITDRNTTLWAIPDATPEQWAAARRYVEQHAPDLADVILGEA